MKLKIMTPEKLVLEEHVDSVTLPGRAGQLTVLDGHDKLIAELSEGRLYYRYVDADGKPVREDFNIGAGCAEVLKDITRVFTEKAAKM